MSDIKQKINDLETNLIKIKKFKNKPIDKYSHKEKILVQKFITGIKEFKNKPMGEKQLFKDFDDLSNNEIYLINIKEIGIIPIGAF